MTLDYQVTEPLTIPDAAFSANDIATLVVTGGSYGGMWALNAISTHTSPDQATAIGSIQTDDAPQRPDLAVEAAEAWMREECERLGFKLAHVANQNHVYPPDQAPFFAGIMFLIDRRK
jgi:hypothetical protein